MSNFIRTAAALFSALGALYAFPALAASACPGSFRGSLIRPLPQPVTVELSVTRQNPENARLADEFADGLRDAGVTVSPSGNLRLGLSFLIHNRSDRGGAQQVDFAWMEHLPAKAGSATIALTAMLVSPNDAAFVWVGSLECVIQTTSKDELARYIGTVIGRDWAATSRVEK